MLGRRLAGLARATHPLPAAAVTILAGGLLVARGTRGAALAWGVAATAAGQASVGWLNDAIDTEEDRAAGRREKPVVGGLVSRGTLVTAAAVALLLAIALAAPLGPPALLVMLAAVLSAWAYDVGLKRTPLSWVPYAISFGLLPVFVGLAAPAGRPPSYWVVAGAALLGVAGHLTNALPDLIVDRASGRRGLPNLLGPRASLWLACVLLAVSLTSALVLQARDGALDVPVAVVGVAGAGLVAAVAVSGARRRFLAGFRLTIAAAAATAAVVAASARGW